MYKELIYQYENVAKRTQHRYNCWLKTLYSTCLLQTSLRKRATIHLVTTMLATSKNVLFPCHNHQYWWPNTLVIAQAPANEGWEYCSGDNQSVSSSALVVSSWLWPGNKTFLEAASMVVTLWIVAFLYRRHLVYLAVSCRNKHCTLKLSSRLFCAKQQINFYCALVFLPEGFVRWILFVSTHNKMTTP